jgi:soluble lytic murein transglycosylase-like protein
MQSNMKHYRKRKLLRRRMRAFYLATGVIFSSLLFVFGMVTVYAKAKEFEEACDAAREVKTVQTVAEPVKVEEVKVEEVKEEEPEVQLYDVPLTEEVQLYIIQLCEEHHIDPSVVMAMIYTESRFQADVVGDSGQAFGLLQIWPKWHYQRMLDLNCTNLLDPKQNVTVGIDLLAELMESGKGIEWALSAYNAGTASANKNGCNDYAELVLAKAGDF